MDHNIVHEYDIEGSPFLIRFLILLHRAASIIRFGEGKNYRGLRGHLTEVETDIAPSCAILLGSGGHLQSTGVARNSDGNLLKDSD